MLGMTTPCVDFKQPYYLYLHTICSCIEMVLMSLIIQFKYSGDSQNALGGGGGILGRK